LEEGARGRRLHTKLNPPLPNPLLPLKRGGEGVKSNNYTHLPEANTL